MLVLFFALGVPLIVTVVRLYPPADNPWYPQCPFRSATGYHCAGCGATRCVHALLTGQFRQAFAYNALFTLLLPFLLALGVNEVHQAWTGRPLFRVRVPAPILIGFAVVAVAFGVARNIDAEPFRQLAPHTIEERAEPN